MKTETMSPTVQARWRIALYLAVAAAWIIIAVAQFMVDTANASSSAPAIKSDIESLKSESSQSEQLGDAEIVDSSSEEWRPIPASIIG